MRVRKEGAGEGGEVLFRTSHFAQVKVRVRKDKGGSHFEGAGEGEERQGRFALHTSQWALGGSDFHF